jgi:hypothetical protein
MKIPIKAVFLIISTLSCLPSLECRSEISGKDLFLRSDSYFSLEYLKISPKEEIDEQEIAIVVYEKIRSTFVSS